MLTTSPTTTKLEKAIAAIQARLEPAPKDRENPHFRSQYADLTSIWGACRGLLGEYGVTVTQWPVHSEDNRLHLITRIAHDGEFMQSHFSVPVGKIDPQGFGSAITYAKRYCLAAALGIVADDDDDGNAASRPASTRQAIVVPKASWQVSQPVQTRADLVKAALPTHGWTVDDVKEFIPLKYNVAKVDQLLPDRFTQFMDILKNQSPADAFRDATADQKSFGEFEEHA